MATDDSDAEMTADAPAVFLNYLVTGVSRLAPAWQSQGADLWLNRMLDSSPKELGLILAAVRPRSAARRRLVGFARRETLRRLIAIARTANMPPAAEPLTTTISTRSSAMAATRGTAPSARPVDRRPQGHSGTASQMFRETHRSTLPDVDARSAFRPDTVDRGAFADPLPLVGAGLLLLWPLIPGLLQKLDLVIDEAFVDLSARLAAVRHLDALIWNDGAVPEWRTGIAKLVCGLSQRELLELDDLEESVRTTHDELLFRFAGAVPELHLLVPQDIRSFFLQRVGTLVEADGVITIEIERSPVDVLLVNLPWPLTSVRFPWMPRPLSIRWL